MAVTLVSLTTVTLVAAMPPTVTALTPVKLVPVKVIAVPPLTLPVAGVIPVSVGALEV